MVVTLTESSVETRFWRPLKINNRYEKLIPAHSPEDLASLEASIIEHKGAFESIKINKKDEILDGHTRYNLCTKNTLGFTTETVDLPSELDEEIYVIESNLRRRQLNLFQTTELNLVLAPLLAQKGQQNIQKHYPMEGEKGFKPICVSDDTHIDSLGTIAEKSKVGRATVAKVKKILEKAPEETKQKLRKGKQSINSAYAQVQEAERQENRNISLIETTAKIPEEVTLIHNDFTKINNLQPETAQLILTDPPYPEEYLNLWDDLAEFSKKMLVPGGYLVAYCGHFHLPVVLEKLKKHLEYFWIIALTQPQHSLVHSRHVFCDWKPILVFYKPPLSLPSYFGDVINGNGHEKDHHDWQQGLSELEPIITNFCPKNGLIIDPFAGSGTTLIAAKKLGRKSIGIEINSETFQIMKKRVSE